MPESSRESGEIQGPHQTLAVVPLFEAPDLDQDELDQFDMLIEQESHTVEGQQKMMDIIGMMVEDRIQKRENRIRAELLEAGVGIERVEDLVAVQAARVTKYDDDALDDGRYNIIVELGGPLQFRYDQERRDEIRKEETTIAIIAHSDTVPETNPEQLKRGTDPKNSDRVTGRGVWDMKGAVLNNLYYIENMDPPPGMRIYLIFTFDEEDRSLGAKRLTKGWRRWPTIDVVYSHEIGPNGAEQPDEQPDEQPEKHALHIARRGRAKMKFWATVPKSRFDHAAGTGVPDAGRALFDAGHLLMQEYPIKKKKSGKRLQEEHELLGRETIDFSDGSWSQTQTGFSRSDIAEFEFSIHCVPPSTVDSVIGGIKGRIEALAQKEEWGALGIEAGVKESSNKTSYTGYELPGGKDHPLAKITASVQEQVSGVAPDIIGANSVADESKYAESILSDEERLAERPYRGVVSHPYLGGNAHGESEWVSLKSMRNVRSVAMNLCMHPSGYRQWISDEAAAVKTGKKDE